MTVLAVMQVEGCASPPSVAPLIRLAGRGIAMERRHIEADEQRGRATLESQRQLLASGYESDLRGRGELEVGWVIEGTRGYVAAREALMESELKQRVEMAKRRESMDAASEALERAASLIERQDALFEAVPDVRRWLNGRLEEKEGR